MSGSETTQGAAIGAVPHSPDEILARVAPEAGYLQGNFRIGSSADAAPVISAALFQPAVFDGIVERLQAAHGGTDRRALVSYWTLYYFSLLSITPIVLAKRAAIMPDIDFATISVSLGDTDDMPKAFVLSTEAGLKPHATPKTALAAIINHLQDAIDFLSQQYGVSPRLLWCNAAVYIDWILKEELPDEEAEMLIASLQCRNGADNPLKGMITTLAGDGQEPAIRRRKVCCLRYLVPGVSGCGMVCPIPQGRS